MVETCNDNPTLFPPGNPSNRVTSPLPASLHAGRELLQKGATMSKIKNLEGSRFGKLIVILKTGARRRGQIVWECKCDCGVVKGIASYYLTSGAVVSCGCHGRSIIGKNTTTHGKSGTPEHTVWKLMRQRCVNPNVDRYANYGGRGVVVCERWNSFSNFLADMGPRPSESHSIERKNNDGNYEPGNCVWATREVQANNTRSNRFIEARRLRLTLAQWSRVLGVKAETLSWRIKRGWPTEKALQ